MNRANKYDPPHIGYVTVREQCDERGDPTFADKVEYIRDNYLREFFDFIKDTDEDALEAFIATNEEDFDKWYREDDWC